MPPSALTEMMAKTVRRTVKLKPMYLYRLRLLAAAPRFYAPSALNAYLERRGLVERTGRLHADERSVEYAITGAGREALGTGVLA